MTSPYHSSFSRFVIDLNQDHDHQQFSCANAEEVAISLSSPSEYPTFINPLLAERGCDRGELLPLQNQLEVANADHAKTYAAQGGSHDHHPSLNNNDVSRVKFFVSKEEDRNEIPSEKSSDKWMSSKMRLMKKMMISDQTVADTPKTSVDKFIDHKDLASPSQTDNSSNTSPTSSNSTTRVCADCNTTKTPLWRSGPRGPKSLCNACGIRQRKAKRAMAAAAAANGTIFASDKPKVKTKKQHREKKTSNTLLPFKKRCKFTAEARTAKKLCFEDLTLFFNKNNALHQRMFPQDEKDAAILLMALSYGLVQG